MTNFAGLRAAALAALLALSSLAPMPAQAAKADLDLLGSYVGEWRGRGDLIGQEKETVQCRLNLSPGNQGKVNYAGRCAMAGTTVSVNGTIAYNDAARRYEAAMTSNVMFTGVAIGRKQGNNIVFNLKEKNKDEEGRDLTVSAAITLGGGGKSIAVDFSVVFTASGESLKASVPFSK